MSPATLATVDGKVAFASAREVPWHHLGTVIDRPMSVEEALKIAHLDWEVDTAEVWARIPGHSSVRVPGKKATVRPTGETMLALGIVGDAYRVVQNAEALSFLDEMIHLDGGGPVIETAGALGHGERVFATVKMPTEIQVTGTDRTDLYVSVVTSHDGTLAVTAAVTPVRMVCQNTVTFGLQSAVRTWRALHTLNVKARMFEARRTLDLTFRYAEEFEREAKALLEVALSERDQRNLLALIWPEKATATDRMKEFSRDRIDRVIALADRDPASGTAWGLVNAVAELVDFYTPIVGKTKKRAWEKRLASVSFGVAAEQKEHAYRIIRNEVSPWATV